MSSKSNVPLKEEKEELVKDTLKEGNIETLGKFEGVQGAMQEDLEAEGRKVAGVDSVVDSKGTVGIDGTRSGLGNCIVGFEHGVKNISNMHLQVDQESPSGNDVDVLNDVNVLDFDNGFDSSTLSPSSSSVITPHPIPLHFPVELQGDGGKRCKTSVTGESGHPLRIV